jgi:hypothetical protein
VVCDTLWLCDAFLSCLEFVRYGVLRAMMRYRLQMNSVSAPFLKKEKIRRMRYFVALRCFFVMTRICVIWRFTCYDAISAADEITFSAILQIGKDSWYVILNGRAMLFRHDSNLCDMAFYVL